MDRKGMMILFGFASLLFVGLGAANTIESNLRQDDNKCTWIVGNDRTPGVDKFPVLPGGGWDNLRNRDMGPVADLSLQNCTLSVDGLYVIPGQVIAYPIKESHVSLMSNVIEHYDNYTSATSNSVNVGGSGSFFDGLLDLGGKYSEEFQEVKKTALYSRTAIGRTQQRYNTYEARVVPDFRFSESFKYRLLDIGNALRNNQTKNTRYLSDLLVRDFGTHVVTSVNAGAILEKVDYFKLDSLSKAVYTTNKMTQCMSVNFLDIFGMDSSVSLTVTTEELKGYKSSIQKTAVNTYGGPAMGAKINLTKWESGLRHNLVAIDRVGELLFTVISHRSLPELPTPYLKGVIDAVKDAVTRYYKMNEVKGCLDPDSPNFEPLANVEGSCDTSLTNFSFGGVYQTCQQSQPNLCGQPHSPVQVNYITGGFSCPDGYEPMPLMSIVGYYERRLTNFWRGIYTEYWTVLSSYWCAARRDRKLPSQSGALYGGAYSPRYDNPSTGAKACGAHFRPYIVGRDITMCVSADMTDAPRSRVPLGGYFSCWAGNPLAEPGRPVVSVKATPQPRVGLAAPPPPPPPPPAPKRCPDGFSQATLDVIDGCELMQCARLSAFDRRRRGIVRRPPYEEPPGGEWASSNLATLPPSSVSSPSTGIGAGVLLAVGIVGTLAFVAAVAAVVALWRHRRYRQLHASTDRQPLLGGGSGHTPI